MWIFGKKAAPIEKQSNTPPEGEVGSVKQDTATLDGLAEDGTRAFFDAAGVSDWEKAIEAMSDDYKAGTLVAQFSETALDTSWKIAAEKRTDAIKDAEDLVRKKIFPVMEGFLNDALESGRAIYEIVWRKDEAGKFGIERLKRHKPLEFSEDTKGRMVYTAGDKPIVLDERLKFVVGTYQAKYGRNGRSIYTRAYFPWHLRQETLRNSMLFIKKSIVPSFLALFDGKGSREEIQKQAQDITNLLRSISNSSGLAISGVREIEELNTTGKASEFISLKDALDMAIASAIVRSATLTENSQHGSYNAKETVKGLLDTAARKLGRDIVVPAINSILNAYFTVNYPNEEPPTVEFTYKSTPTWEMVMQALDRGIEVDERWLRDTYGIPKNEDPQKNISFEASVAGAKSILFDDSDPVDGVL